MSKKRIVMLGSLVLVAWMSSVASAQPPVREVEGREPATPTTQQPAQSTQQQGEIPKLREIKTRDAGAQAAKMQRSLPAQAQQQAGQPGQPGQPAQTRQMQIQPGQTRMKQMPAQMMIQPGPGPYWYLGVWDEHAPLGVRVSSVSWNSPASRLGLEPGDYIMDVMGYPVGWYQGWYYPLSLALNNYAQPDGWVNVMIWNKRTGRKQPFWVQLQRRY